MGLSMWDWIVLRKVIASFVLPPAGPLLCVVLGLLLAYKHERLGRRLAWLGVLSLLLLSLPVVSGWLVSGVGDSRPLDLARAPCAGDRHTGWGQAGNGPRVRPGHPWRPHAGTGALWRLPGAENGFADAELPAEWCGRERRKRC